MDPEIVTVEVNTFTEQEAQKVFTYLCSKVVKRHATLVKKHVLRLKKGETVNWGHVMYMLYRYGLNGKLTFEHDPNEKMSKLTNRELNQLRLEKGLAALPDKVDVEKL